MASNSVRPRLRRGETLAATLLLAPWLAGVALAQEDAFLPGTSDAFVLDPILLEGTKFQRDFANTAASVGFIDSATMEEQGITDLRDSFSLFGNVRYFEGGSGNAGFVIRGLSAEGVTQSLNTSPLTSVIVDGTTQTVETMRRGARGVWDAEQVEIYRGPQSTIQGRGALAGAVVVETKDPTFAFEGDLRAIMGEQSRRELAFALSGPLVENVLAFRISGETRERERGIEFGFPGFDFIDEDRYRNLRAKLLFLPPDMPGLSFKLTVSDTYDRPGLSVVTGPDFFDRKFGVDSAYPLEAREADNLNIAFETKYDFGNGVELTSISSWLDATTTLFSPGGIAYTRDAEWRDDNFTQDIRLTFGGQDAEISGVLGLYYGRFTSKRNDLMTYTYPGPFVSEIQNYKRDTKTTHISAYGEVDWRFAPNWTATLGGRLLNEEVSDSIKGRIYLSPVSLSDTTEDTVFLPKVGLTYHFSEDQTLAFTVQRGYRSGFVALQDEGGPTQVDPEYLTNYELAYRVEDPDGFWRFGATAFYSRYTDQQVVVARPFPEIPRTENAGESEMYGVEMEGAYSFENGLNLFGSVGLLHTEFVDFGPAVDGNEFPESPQLTAGLGVSYEHPSGAFGSLMASYTSGYYSTGAIENERTLKVEDFTRVDAQVGYRFDNNTELVFYADNLFDNDYVTSLSGGPPPTEATVSEPRTVGVQLRARF